MNAFVVTGRLIRKPELKTGKSGEHYCRFTLAVRKEFVGTQKRTNVKNAVQFFDFICFRSSADFICHYGRKGDHLIVIGHVNVFIRKKENGYNENIPELLADTLEIVHSGNGQDQKEGTMADEIMDTIGESQFDYSQILEEFDEEDTPF